ncbi:hypothetical protein [Nocardia sp. NPDC005745]|uniref:hypothetical protein n=1 Tax=Nocardia sp. NPDC005745 TaxID=3157061 RepID=UPI00340F80B6
MTESYIITISDGQTGAALVTARAEIDASGTRLTEVRSGAVDKFVPEALAHIDFPLLIRTANILSGMNPNPVAQKQDAESDDIPPDTAATGQVFVPPDPVVSRRAAHKDSVGPSRTQKRSMPDDFGVAYWRLGSISKVARHYDVPHHIAQDWIRSLQQQGKLANPWPKKKERSARPQ